MPRLRTLPLLLPFILAGSLAAGPEVITNMIVLCKALASPMSLLGNRNDSCARFIEKANNSLIITNKTKKAWKFGYVSDCKTEVRDKPSGSLKLASIPYDFDGYTDDGALKADAAPVLVPLNYGALIVTPVYETSMLRSKPFFRVVYLQDEAGNRINLNLTRGTSSGDVPVVGIAQASYSKVMAGKLLELYTPTVMKDPKLKKMNMIAIGADGVEP